jgi:hypothetical protein
MVCGRSPDRPATFSSSSLVQQINGVVAPRSCKGVIPLFSGRSRQRAECLRDRPRQSMFACRLRNGTPTRACCQRSSDWPLAVLPRDWFRDCFVEASKGHCATTARSGDAAEPRRNQFQQCLSCHEAVTESILVASAILKRNNRLNTASTVHMAPINYRFW